MTKQKIFLGPQEVAGQVSLYSKALRELGFNANSFSHVNPLRYDVDVTMSYSNIPANGINRYFKLAYLSAFSLLQIGRFDIYHFFMMKTLLSFTYKELPFVKFFGGKILMEVCGEEVRLPSIASINNPYMKSLYKSKDSSLYFFNRFKGDESKVLSEMDRLSKFIEHVICPDEELHDYLEGRFANIHRVRQSIDLMNLRPIYYQRNDNPVRILYRPSQGVIKGSHWVLPILEKLKKERKDINIIMPSKLLCKKDFLSLMSTCDIVIDQFCLGSYGGLALEAMALGKPVFCYLRDDLILRYPEPPPILSRGIDYLYEDILLLVKNRELINDYGQKGRIYVENYHDLRSNVLKISSIYNIILAQ